MKFAGTLVRRTVMVAALALGGGALHAQDGVTKTSITIGQSVALTRPRLPAGRAVPPGRQDVL
jgi:hypothetical protein